MWSQGVNRPVLSLLFLQAGGEGLSLALVASSGSLTGGYITPDSTFVCTWLVSLCLQRPCFHIKSHSELPNSSKFEEDTTQPIVVPFQIF